MIKSSVIYRGSLPSLQRFSPSKGTNADLLQGIPYMTDDLELLLQLDGRADFEVKYSAEDIKKLSENKSINQLKDMLKKWGVADTRDLSSKKELVDKIKELKQI